MDVIDEVPRIALDPFLSTEAVTGFTGFSRQTLWREVKAGRFPKPVQLTPQRQGWLQSEVQKWQRDRVANRENPEFKAKGGGRPRKTKGATRAKPWEKRRPTAE
jgi:prophage regulatory protein